MQKQLQEKAMLAKLNISQWTARRYDKNVSDEVAELKHTVGNKDDVGRYNKILITQDAVKKVGKVVGEARDFHYKMTLPWTDDGARILPSSNYERYMKGMRERRATFEERVREFCANYPALVKDAKRRLNGMFNAADYPSAAEINWRYSWNVGFDPLPTGGDFRVGLAGTEVERIAKEIDDRLTAATQAAMKDLWGRLHTVVSRMAEKLKDADAVFRDTLVGNIVELVELLPALNLTDDPELEAMRRRVETTLCSYRPQDLRDDKRERQNAARDADAILKAMSAYTGGEQK